MLSVCLSYIGVTRQNSSTIQEISWDKVESSLEVDREVKEVDWIAPGTKKGLEEISNFCLKRLRIYGDKRNDPNLKALSNLSPWINFGKHFKNSFTIIFLWKSTNQSYQLNEFQVKFLLNGVYLKLKNSKVSILRE